MWFGLIFLTDNNTTSKKVDLSCFGFLVELWQKCWVCLKRIDRIGLNYGRESCDVCRVFFHHMVVKKEAVICKSKQECLVPDPGAVTCGPCLR